jgi:hypothetical protein
MLLLSLLLFYDDVSSSSLSSVEIFLLSVDPSLIVDNGNFEC